MSPSVVLSRPSPYNVPPGNGAVLAARGGRVEKESLSVAELPAALLNGLFEHPASPSCFNAIRKAGLEHKLSYSGVC